MVSYCGGGGVDGDGDIDVLMLGEVDWIWDVGIEEM